MRIGIVILKNTDGEFINIHSSSARSDAKAIFNSLKAELRTHKARGEAEVCTVNGEEIETVALWYFTNHEGRYVSQNGYLVESELKAIEAQKRDKAKTVAKAKAKADAKAEADAKKADAKKVEAVKKAEADAKAKAVKLAEDEALAIKAKKAPKAKPAKKVKK